ncbi:hypothetical protein ACRBEJ_13720 [Yersinia proxima]|uniref:hypothetical protein n=1 Tax=Yersinia proxima TaxID=2890316 RepID=UPI0006799D20|nr:hypothetical protein [Yersinia proxima]
MVNAIFDEWKELEQDPSEFLRSLELNTRKRLFASCNFLKKLFLDACNDLGLFDVLPQQSE